MTVLSRQSLVLLLAAACLPLAAQAPGSIDAEGNKYFPNGLGRYPLRRQGIWKVTPLNNPTGNPSRAPAIVPAELQGIQSAMNALSAIFKATPESKVLEGYWMRESRTFDYPDKAGQPPEFALARFPFPFCAGFYPFYLEDVLTNGKYIPQWAGETAAIYFWFNRLPGSMGRRTVLTEMLANEHQVDIYPRPRITGTYQGHPVIEEQDLLIARPGRDPWIAVPYARALKLAIPRLEKDRDAAEKRLADLKKKNAETQAPAYEAQMRAHLEKYSGEFRTSNPEKWKGRVAGMERELQYNREKAAKDANPTRDKDGRWYWNPIDALADANKRVATLTPADATAPSCFLAASKEAADGRYALDGSIERLGANPACEALMTDNHAYFDPKLPRSEAQILFVRSLSRCGKVVDGKFIAAEKVDPNKPSQGCKRHPLYWEQMDWTKVAALVTR
jgi:hypothetical protein